MVENDIEGRTYNNKEYLDLILRSVDIIVWSATFPDLKLLYISPSSEHILGLDPQKLVNKNDLWYQYVHPDDLNIVQNAAKQRELEGTVSTEYRILRPDGSTFWIRESSEIKYDTNNVPVSVEGILTDIDRSKKAEEELHSREERLRSLVSILQYTPDSAQDFLDFALNEAIKLTRSMIGYIYYYNEEKKEFILNSWSNEVMKECSITEPQTTYKLEHTGIWGEAVRQRKEIIVNDFQAPCALKKGYPEGHVELFRYMTVPVIINGKVVAVVGVANKGSDYNEADVLNLTLLMESVWNIVEHMKMEKALQESEKRHLQAYDILQSVLESPTDVVIFALDREYRYLAFNTNHQLTMEQIWGANIENDANMLDYIKSAKDREKAKENFDRALAGEAFTLIEEYGESLLERRWYANIYSPLKDAEGNIIGITLILTDITLRKRSEQALLAEEARTRAIAESAQDAILMMDPQGNISFWNPAAERIFGYSMEETIGQNLHLLLAPQRYHVSQQEALSKFLKNGQGNAVGKTLELEALCKDGREISVELSLSVIELPDGWHSVGIMRDITGRKLTEQQLTESEERHRLLADNSTDVIWTMDIEGKFTYVSPSVQKLRGYTPEEVMKQKPEEFLTPDSLQQYLEGLKLATEIVQAGMNFSSQRFELEQPSKDGSTVWTEATINGMYNEQGKFIGILGVTRDITERKGLEKNLIIEMEKAQEATRVKSEFLANMSHEIRTPMNGVIGMTGLLLDTDLSDEQRHYAETVRLSGESLLQLINDILDFSKIEAGKLELEMVDFDLHNMLDDFASMISIKAHEKELEFICAPAPDVPACVQGDPGRLQQVLTNLAGNAVKFTHKGEVVVQVTLESQSTTEALLRFSVRDTGVGIPENKKHDLFDKFYQVDASTTRQYGGTGLGLAISKQLVEMMGGDIGVESEKGKGSEFWFRISLEKQPESGRKKVHSAEIMGSYVLVVDDNATNREILNKRISSWGVKVDEAVDGPTALQALYRAHEDGEQYHVVILDMHMPGMDGESVARFIKSDAKLKDIPLVMLSSLGQRSNLQNPGERYFAAYLTKPVRHQELFDVLSGILNMEKQRSKAHTRVNTSSVPSQIQKNLRILLAEDNIVNQKVAQGMLQKLGYHADTVANGIEAIKALEILPYDMVLMDVQMPDMDGFEATSLIRDPRSAVLDHEIPIVAMTAYAMKGDKERCLEAGMNDYIAKPVSLQSLMQLLDKWQSILGYESSWNGISAEGMKDPTDQLVFDRPALLERVMDDEDLSRRLIAIFLEDMPKQVIALRDSIVKRELENVNVYAHKIKGASANIGGMALSAMASQMEIAGNKSQVDKMDILLPELEKHYDLLVEQLKNM
ncbi:PAS domain S-box protein [Methanolobus psychrotolerans]|uniref:PAS domain S-box protein n=1 Tax=Methanolobus psychrotolerans TaxID=1874706 RepID=UPI000B91D187|nr:PAS domain S-box protein [Methanolobus psychrotolerans]